MEGSATSTIVKSSTTMNCAIANVTSKAPPGAAGARAPVPGARAHGRDTLGSATRVPSRSRQRIPVGDHATRFQGTFGPGSIRFVPRGPGRARPDPGRSGHPHRESFLARPATLRCPVGEPPRCPGQARNAGASAGFAT